MEGDIRLTILVDLTLKSFSKNMALNTLCEKETEGCNTSSPVLGYIYTVVAAWLTVLCSFILMVNLVTSAYMHTVLINIGMSIVSIMNLMLTVFLLMRTAFNY